MAKVVVIDYGIGNLLSVTRAFSAVGADVELSNAHNAIRDADRLVLPGVGAFGDGMRGLQQRGLVEPIRDFATRSRPFLGICLGMQLMLDESEEFGHHEGLGLVAGKVAKVPATGIDGQPVKIPHIGWNALHTAGRNNWDAPILKDVPEGSACYFVHSYMAVPSEPQSLLACCDYAGLQITATLGQGMLYGCQFHPEKSGKVGLKILENFTRL
ncbi:MAG: imidazole glycerol phosphate synthase subunit HisH [Alphaproteobacteria bacterium]|nr:imidazole glycerol phosphate synthase subunit HisH [Alphaproteobacteria bacterium]